MENNKNQELNNKLAEIKEFISKNGYDYEPINKDLEESINKIHNLLIKDIFEEATTGIEHLYFGIYYKIKQKYETMKEHLFIATYTGFVQAMYILGNHYREQKDYENMLKYYQMACDKGEHSRAAIFIGVHYHNKKDYDKAFEYYTLALKFNKNNKIATFNMGLIYSIRGDKKNMEKYYLESLKSDKNYNKPFNELVKFYKEDNDDVPLINLYRMLNKDKEIAQCIINLLNKDNQDNKDNQEKLKVILDCLKEVDIDLEKVKGIQIPTWLRILQSAIKENIEVLDLHFRYSLEGKGFDEAKNDFYERITNMK